MSEPDNFTRTVKNNHAPKVVCKHCGGSGKVPLSLDLQETLTALKKLRESTTIKMAAALGWTGHVTAMNNRLDDLEKLGLVTRHRASHGRQWIYKPA